LCIDKAQIHKVMRNIILNFTVAIFIIALPSIVHAQPWDIGGNNISTSEWFGADGTSSIPLEIRHNNVSTPLPINFFTANAQRMTLTGTGFLGLNTTTPLMRFHVLDGGILSSGTTGTNPDMGAGTRLMWIPDRAAFRAGRITGADSSDEFWDTPNVGFGSVAMGLDNLALGEAAISLGSLNRVFGLHSVALGYCNNLAADNNYSPLARFYKACGL